MEFELKQQVRLRLSDLETGIVIGRAEYSNADPTYLVRYRAADGRMVEGWWSEDALASVP